MKVRITLWPLQGNLRHVNATELGSTCCHRLIALGLVMSVRSLFPSRSASSYSCITARVDIIAAATGELQPNCDLAAADQKPAQIGSISAKPGGFSSFISILRILMFDVQSLNSDAADGERRTRVFPVPPHLRMHQSQSRLLCR